MSHISENPYIGNRRHPVSAPRRAGRAHERGSTAGPLLRWPPHRCDSPRSELCELLHTPATHRGRTEANPTTMEPEADSYPGQSRSGVRAHQAAATRIRGAVPTKTRDLLPSRPASGYEMGDTTCLVAKAADGGAESPQNSTSTSGNVSAVPATRRRPSAAAPEHYTGSASGSRHAEGASSLTSVSVEVHRPSVQRRHHGKRAPTTAKHGRPSPQEDPASSVEVSSAVALSPGASGKCSVNIDIEFGKPIVAASSRRKLLRSISLNVERIVGRLLAPPRSNVRRQRRRSVGSDEAPVERERESALSELEAESPPRETEATSASQARRTSSTGSVKHKALGGVPYVLEEIDESLATQMDTISGLVEEPTQPKKLKKPKEEKKEKKRRKSSTKEDESGAGMASKARRSSSTVSIRGKALGGVSDVLEKIEESLGTQGETVSGLAEKKKRRRSKVKEPKEEKKEKRRRKSSKEKEPDSEERVASKERRRSSTGSFMRNALRGAPDVLEKIEESLASQVETASGFAEEKKPSRSKKKKFEEEGKKEKTRRKSKESEEIMASKLRRSSSTGSLKGKALHGVPDVLEKIEESLVTEGETVSVLAEGKKKSSRSKGRRPEEEKTEKRRRKPSKEKEDESTEGMAYKVRRTSSTGSVKGKTLGGVFDVLEKFEGSLEAEVEAASGLAEEEKPSRYKVKKPKEEKREKRRRKSSKEKETESGERMASKERRRSSTASVMRNGLRGVPDISEKIEGSSETQVDAVSGLAGDVPTRSKKVRTHKEETKEKRRRKPSKEKEDESAEGMASKVRTSSTGFVKGQALGGVSDFQKFEGPLETEVETASGLAEEKPSRSKVKKPKEEKREKRRRKSSKEKETESDERRRSSTGSLMRHTLRGAPDILEKIEESLASQVETASGLAEEEKPSRSKVKKRKEEKRGKRRRKSSKEKETESDERRRSSTGSLMRHTLRGAPDILEKIEESLASQVETASGLAEEEKPSRSKVKKRKEEKRGKRRRKSSKEKETESEERRRSSTGTLMRNTLRGAPDDLEKIEESLASQVETASGLAEEKIPSRSKKKEFEEEEKKEKKRRKSKESEERMASKLRRRSSTGSVIGKAQRGVPDVLEKIEESLATQGETVSVLGEGKKPSRSKGRRPKEEKTEKRRRKPSKEKEGESAEGMTSEVRRISSTESVKSKALGEVPDVLEKSEGSLATEVETASDKQRPAAGEKMHALPPGPPKHGIIRRRSTDLDFLKLVHEKAKRRKSSIDSAALTVPSTIDTSETPFGPRVKQAYAQPGKPTEPDLPKEVDIETATSRQSRKLNKGQKKKRRHKEHAEAASPSGTFKWSTSTLPGYIRDALFAADRVPVRPLVWSTQAFASPHGPPLSHTLAPDPGRTASFVRIHPLNIELKDSKPAMPPDSMKKRKKKKKKKKKRKEERQKKQGKPLLFSGSFTSETGGPETSSFIGELPVAFSGDGRASAPAEQRHSLVGPPGAPTERRHSLVGPAEQRHSLVGPPGAPAEQWHSPVGPPGAPAQQRHSLVGPPGAPATRPGTGGIAWESSKVLGFPDVLADERHSLLAPPGELPGSQSEQATALTSTAGAPTESTGEALLDEKIGKEEKKGSRKGGERKKSKKRGSKKKSGSKRKRKGKEAEGELAPFAQAPAPAVEGAPGPQAALEAEMGPGVEIPKLTLDRNSLGDHPKKSKKGKKGGSKKEKKKEGKTGETAESAKSSKTKKGGRKKRRGKKGAREVVVRQGNQGAVVCCVLLSTICLIILLTLAFYVLCVKGAPPETTTLSTYTSTATNTGTTGTSSKPVRPPTHPPVSGAYLCKTDYCTREADYLRSLLQSSQTTACSNLYEHVCDGWRAQHPLLPKAANVHVSVDSLLQDELAGRLITTAKEMGHGDLKLAADVYDACVDRTKIESSVQAIHRMFNKWSIGEWPVEDESSTASSEEKAWKFAAELYRDLTLVTFTSVDFIVDPDSPKDLKLKLGHPGPAKKALGRPELKDVVSRAFIEVAEAIRPVRQEPELGSQVAEVFDKLFGPYSTGAFSSYPSVPVSELTSGLRMFLDTLFESGTVTNVAVDSEEYLTGTLLSIKDMKPPDVLNALGLMALIRLAPYLPESLENLRNLFAQSVLGRALGDVRNSSVLCLRSTELLLPAIFSRTARAMLRQKTEDVTVREWLSQMVSVFARRVRFLSWMSELSALFVRYRLKRAPLPWLTDGPDGPTGSPVINTTIYSVPVRLFQILASAMQQDLIEGYKGRTLRAERFPTSSELHPFATFDASHRHVRVPTVLVNLSVPLTSSVFAFQLARLGVRLYRPLARVLFDDPYETEAPVDDMAGAQQAVRELRECLTKDATQLYRSEANALGSDEVAGELLERVTALQIAFWAFQELLNVRRIWNMDFRYAKLDLSAEQLFFLYFALDNCESSDNVHHELQGRALSADQAVLLAVRHVPDFGRAFNCTGQTKSHLPDGAQCEIVPRHKRARMGLLSTRRTSKKPFQGLASIFGLQLGLV